jgi:hypothetical protein
MRGLIVGATTAYAAACTAKAARTPPPPPAAAPAPMLGLAYPGESAEFVLSFRGFVVGRVTVAVGAQGELEGQRVIMYSARGETEGLVTLLGHVKWNLDTTVDLDRAVAVSDYEETWIGLGDDIEHIIREHSDSIDSMVHDIQSAVCAVRGWKSRVGDRVAFRMVFASVSVDVDMWDAARGNAPDMIVPGVRYEGTIDGDTPFVAWMSDDADRVPLDVRIASSYGEIMVQLVEYRAPRTTPLTAARD